MQLTALVKSPDHVCCRYRVAAFGPHLESLGHHVDIRPWSGGWFLQQMFPSWIDDSDVLIVQRKLFPAWQLKLLRRSVRWLVYDFDDSIFLNSSYNPREGQDCPKRFQQFRQMVQGCRCRHRRQPILARPGRYVDRTGQGALDPDRCEREPLCAGDT